MLRLFSHNCAGYLINNYEGNVSPIYRWMDHCVRNGSKVIYAVEPVPLWVVSKLLKMDEEIPRYLENKSLQVLSPETFVSSLTLKNCRQEDAILDKWLSLTNEVADGSKSSSILIISTPELLASGAGLETLQLTARRLDRDCLDHVEVICCYGLGHYFGLSLGEAISLMFMNQRNIRRCDSPGLVITKSRIIDVICKGLDRSLGKGSGRLIMTTLKYLHQIDSDDLLADPYLLEVRLRRLIGNMADYAFGYVLTAIKDELIFTQQHLMRLPSSDIFST